MMPYTSWYDFSDRNTWYVDAECTIGTLIMDQVRYVKNKLGPGAMAVGKLQTDGDGRIFSEGIWQGPISLKREDMPRAKAKMYFLAQG